jgi:XTP/dITP diphosphohydrolase
VTTLIIATRNAHKVGEIRFILGESFRYLTLKDFPGAPEVVENAPTFIGNATKKAVEVARWLSRTRGAECGVSHENVFVLADDSGLEVDALNGAPGVQSARFAALDSGEPNNSSDEANRSKLLRVMRDVAAEKRTAQFRCVIALTPLLGDRTESASPVCYADEFELATQTFEGKCDGRIQFTPTGHGGFGYDSLFVPEGFSQSFAELGEDVKNRLSHRARALEELKRTLASAVNPTGEKRN